MKKRPKCIILF